MSECTENHALLLRRAMRDASLSLAECANLVGLSSATVLDYAHGVREPDSHDEWDRIFAAIEAHRTRGAP